MEKRILMMMPNKEEERKKLFTYRLSIKGSGKLERMRDRWREIKETEDRENE